MSLERKTPLRRTGRIKGRVKPMANVNPERQAKRRKSYAQKLAAYRRSETYRVVEKRAGGCCEAMDKYGRCGSERRFGYVLQHHHKTYARFGGDELPEDMIVLCEHHHALAEAAHPTRNRNYRAPSSGQGAA